MTIDTVLVTGSNGGVGGAAVAELDGAGYDVASFDREGGCPDGADRHWTGDLLEPETVAAVVRESDADAIVHLGTLPHPEGRPGHETYRSNAMTTYHVLEAAADHGIERVSLASSLNAVGGVFQEAPMAVEYLPMDEDHPVSPRDPYALGKRTIELQADGFARRVGPPTAVASFRLPFVAGPDAMRERFLEPDRTLDGIEPGAWVTRDDLFAYVGRRDAARALRRGIEADFSGHERFFLSARDTTAGTPTPELVERCYPDASVGDLDGFDALISAEKAERLLDWEPRVSWRDLSSDLADAGRAATGRRGAQD